jgi:membrane protease YdiL (CAAX protease family)
MMGGMSWLLLAAVLAVLVVVNLLNHRWRSHWYVRTCLVGTAVILGIGLAGGLSWSDLGLGRASLVPGLLWGGAALLVVVLIYSVGLSMPRTRRFFVDERLADRPGPTVARHALVEVPFGTVTLEEAAFRGVLFADLVIATDTATAVIVTSMLFGFWHVLPALAWHESNAGIADAFGERHHQGRAVVVVLTVLGTAAAGVVFCALLLISNSLLAPMALHWATNGLGVFIAWWIRRR